MAVNSPNLLLSWIGNQGQLPVLIKSVYHAREGGKVQFPEATCLNCPLRKKCTTSKKGRTVSIHPDEKFIAELRQRQLTPTVGG